MKSNVLYAYGCIVSRKIQCTCVCRSSWIDGVFTRVCLLVSAYRKHVTHPHSYTDIYTHACTHSCAYRYTPIYICPNHTCTCRVATQTLIYRGVQPVYLQDRVMRNSFECVRVAISYAKDMGICKVPTRVCSMYKVSCTDAFAHMHWCFVTHVHSHRRTILCKALHNWSWFILVWHTLIECVHVYMYLVYMLYSSPHPSIRPYIHAHIYTYTHIT